MHRQQLQFNRQPFQDTIDTTFFFEGGGRRAVVEEIRTALAQAVPLIVLTGAEGTGKTMVCKMVELELPADIIPVFIPRTIESFGDMVSIVAQEISVSQMEGEQELDTKALLQAVVDYLKNRSQRLVIVFDEAESIYLATLERIRKVLDQVNEGGVVFQVLFSGREQLLDNLKQLGIVTFQEIEERYFTLEALDQETTASYLNHCIRVASGEDNDVFNHEISQSIFTGTQGNFKQIHYIARETLKSDKLDTSFLGLLDTVKDDSGSRTKNETNRRRSRVSAKSEEVDLEFLNFSRIIPAWLLYGGGICLVGLLIFFLVGKYGKDMSEDETIQEVPIIELQRVEPLESVQVENPRKEETEESRPQDPKPEESVIVSLPEKPAEQKDRAESESAISPPVAMSEAADIGRIVENNAVSAKKTFTEIVSQPQGDEAPDEGDMDVQTSAMPQTQEVQKDPLSEAISLETPNKIVSEQTNATPQTQEVQKIPPSEVISLETPDKNVSEQRTASLPEKPLENVESSSFDSNSAEEIFVERIAAGARWLVGGSNGKYTVQLMVLTSEKAEENLKKMLISEEYQSVAEQLYILRRVGALSTVMVFYGEYPTLAAARNARNNLPVFLRKHHPYAISVHGAVEKARNTRS